MSFENPFKRIITKIDTKEVSKENLPVNQLVDDGTILFGRDDDFKDGALKRKYEERIEKKIFPKEKDEFTAWLNKENGASINTPIRILINTNGTIEVYMDGNKRMFGAYKLGILPKDIPVKCTQYDFTPSEIANTTLDKVLQKAFEVRQIK